MDYMERSAMKRSHLEQGATLEQKYKALIVDVDGTIIPKKKDGVPSKKVIDAIAQARKSIHIGIATSRPLSYLTNILDHIEFSGPSPKPTSTHSE